MVIVYQKEGFDQYIGCPLLIMHEYNNGVLTRNEVAASFETLNYDSKPVVTGQFDNWGDYWFVVVWKPSPSSPLKTKLYYQNPQGSQSFSWSEELSVPNTNANSSNPSISMYYQDVVGLVWQQSMSSIKYIEMGLNDYYNNLTFSNYYDVSAGNGYEKNYNPVISQTGWRNVVSWTASKKWELLKSTTPPDEHPGVTNAFIREGAGNVWNSVFSSFGSKVERTFCGSVDENVGTLLTWSEENVNNSKFVRKKNGAFTPILSFPEVSPFAQITQHANYFSQIKAVAFNTKTPAPYLLTKSSIDFSNLPGDIPSKEEFRDPEGVYGLRATAYNGQAELTFYIGDALLEGRLLGIGNSATQRR